MDIALFVLGGSDGTDSETGLGYCEGLLCGMVPRNNWPYRALSKGFDERSHVRGFRPRQYDLAAKPP